MPPIHDFVRAFTVAGKSFKEIQETVKNLYVNRSRKKTQIYEIIETVKERKPAADQRHFNG
jgi:hypothetical protein